ncbi:putative acid sphingomyelinase [Hypoxylon sp. FL0543]|nr:putative acid sphingomyelinase [Hypoxylon sp. FL0543]
MWVLSLIIILALNLGRGIAAQSDPRGGFQKVLTSGSREGVLGGLDLDAVAASIGEDVQSPVACATCEAILLQLKLIALRGDDFFVDVVTELCKRSGVEDDDVCAGSIALEGPIVANSLRGITVGSRTSRLACVAFMGLCSYPEVEPYNVSFPSPKPRTERPRPSGLKPLRVVHFSDIHVDPLYVEGANANCSKPICCRQYADDDRPGNTDFPAGPNGEHTCDAPISLEESMYAAIRDIVPDAAFSIFTGDIVDHAVWATSQLRNILSIADAYSRMADAGMLMYGTAGNHEASPANSFPPAAASNSSQWLYDLLSSAWSPWIGTRAADTTREFGAYSVRYPGGIGTGKLRIISISTNMYYAHNYWLYEEPMERDPSGQLAWLVGELDAAEREGERVYIIGHMPMGSRDAFHDGSNYFDQIVNRYSETIAAMFFGHTHFDEFQISYADYSNRSHANALAISYVAPSMTPTSGHPAFRVYAVDPVTFGVLDATTYIANMSDPDFSTKPKWTKYYSAKEAYGPLTKMAEGEGENVVLGEHEELTPAFWHNVTEAFERNATAFEEYFARRRRGWAVQPCEGECRSAEICKLRGARAQDNCMSPGFRLCDTEKPKKGPGAGIDEEECGGSVIRNTLGSMAVDLGMLRAFEEVVVEKGLLV